MSLTAADPRVRACAGAPAGPQSRPERDSSRAGTALSGLPRGAALDTGINVILRRQHAAPFELPLELDAPGIAEDLKAAYGDQALAG